MKTLTTDTLFNQTLHYNDSYGGSRACYNGNISGMSWKAAGDTGVHGYRFSYDEMSRLTAAGYLWNGSPSANYDTSYTYNRQSNLTSLRRNGRTGASSYGLIDDLTFALDGNWLTRVDDAATASAYNNGFEFKDAVKQDNEYTYDKNGNMTKDLNKNITEIQYNCLNSPSKVTFQDGSTITYTYAVNGTKLRTVHKIGDTTTTTDYCGNVIYENGVQKLLLTDAGHVTLSDKKYHYYLQDHQGNNRVVVDQTGQKEEVNHYYPFGGTFASAEKSIQPYKYNGKELDTKNGLNWYDYGARQYDVVIGRWNAVDLMADSYYQFSPYSYCGGNPICHRDEEGKFINNIIGAVIGGAVDLGVQVAANIVTGDGAFDNIDWVSVGTSALEGGLTSGMSAGKTLVVKATASIVKNTTNAIMDGNLNNAKDALNVMTKSTEDVVSNKIIGKAGDMLGKGVKSAIPQIKEISQKSSRVISNNKATQLARKFPGVSDTKTARKIATSRNGIVDASKTINKKMQKAPENTAKFGLEVTKKIYLDDKDRK